MSKEIKYKDAVPNSIVNRYKEELLAQPEQEPVAWIDVGSLKSLQAATGYALRYLTNDTENLNVDDVPLYTSPPTKREPLSEDKLKTIAVEDGLLAYCDEDEFIDIARAIEKHTVLE
jgi:hypothetical protein